MRSDLDNDVAPRSLLKLRWSLLKRNWNVFCLLACLWILIHRCCIDMLVFSISTSSCSSRKALFCSARIIIYIQDILDGAVSTIVTTVYKIIKIHSFDFQEFLDIILEQRLFVYCYNRIRWLQFKLISNDEVLFVSIFLPGFCHRSAWAILLFFFMNSLPSEKKNWVGIDLLHLYCFCITEINQNINNKSQYAALEKLLYDEYST